MQTRGELCLSKLCREGVSMSDFTRSQKIAMVAAYTVVVLTFVALSVIALRSNAFRASNSSEVEFTEADTDTAVSEISTEPTPGSSKVCVHVTGKVENPGVYELEPGSRVKDAIESAGGALPNADLENINLAQKLSDGEQVYIAPKGEIPPPVTSTVRGSEEMQSSTIATSTSDREHSRTSASEKLTHPGQGTVNINTAGLQELQRLPGVGPATAQKIIDYRTQNGRFDSVDELEEVSGIGPAKLEKMRPFVRL